MVKFGWDKLKRFLAQANTWTGQQTFSNIAVTGGTIGGATITENLTTSTDPAANAAVTTAIVNSYNGVVVTLTAAGNTQTIQNPTTAATIRKFMVVNNDTSNNNLSVVANSVTFVLTPGEGQCFIWDGTAWGPTDLGITSLPVPVTQGGTGLATITDHGVMVGSGTGAVTPLSAGTNGQVLVGSTGADPVFATITDGEGIDTTLGAGTLTIACEDASTTNKGVVELATVAEAVAGTSTTLTPTCDGVAAAVAVVERAPNQGVALTYAASGTGIQVADNDNIDFGTGNFFGVIHVLLADYTPSAEVVLEQKTDGTNGREFTLQTNGKLRVTINTTDYDSTVATGCTDNTKHVFGYSVTRETAAAAGSIIFVVDGVQLGDAVAITAGAPTTVNNAVSQYVLGTSATRTAGTVNGYISGNRALTAAEHLALYRNGIAESDKWGSQTWNGITNTVDSDFSGAGNWYGTGNHTVTITGGEMQVVASGAGGTSANATVLDYSNFTIPSSGKNSNFQFQARISTGTGTLYYRTHCGTTGTVSLTSTMQTYDISLKSTGIEDHLYFSLSEAGTFYIDNVKIIETGATLALEPEGIQPNPGQWLDSSTNKLHAMQPATGSSLTRRKKDFEYRWTNTWTASSAAQYVGGLNQAVLSADHFITDIITQATVTTDVENLTLGDGSDADRFVTAFAPSATRTKQTVAAQNDGTNLKLVYTPAAEATMTVETIIRGFIWEP
jgi:hypothetical protein